MDLSTYVRSISCSARDVMKSSSAELSIEVSRAPPPFMWSSLVRQRIDASAKLTGSVNTYKQNSN